MVGDRVANLKYARRSESLGFRAEGFSSAEEFLTSSRLHETDCLILDVRMPGLNGLSLRQHRSEASFSSIDLGTAKDIETGFQAASKGHADAALVLTNVFAIAQPNHIAELAVKSRIPVIFPRVSMWRLAD